MMKFARSVLAASLVAFLVTPATVARAADPGCNDRTDQCEIVIVDPGTPADPSPGDPAPAPKKKVVPDCAGLGAGVIAPVGSSLADLGLDDAAHAGWIHVTCLDGNDVMWMWLDPGVAAESIARMLLARLQLQPIRIGWTPLRAGAMGIVGIPTWLWVDNPGRVTWALITSVRSRIITPAPGSPRSAQISAGRSPPSASPPPVCAARKAAPALRRSSG